MGLLQHPLVQSLAEAISKSPWAGEVCLVGGCVRDDLLGLPLKNDFDLVLEGDAVALAEWLFESGWASGPAAVYPRFGTAMVRRDNVCFELVGARVESYATDSRKPEVRVGTLLDDARRRDFTVNALMVRLDSGELLDLLGQGVADLRDRILRTPLDPLTTFRDDPLRMLRAVRFKNQLGFHLAPDLAEAIQRESERLEIISAERVREELFKMLVLPAGPQALEDLRELGLLRVFAPELMAMKGVTQGKWHHLDVWDHTRLVLQNAGTQDIALALGCLLHDVAKPVTRTVDDQDQVRFFGHEVVGADMASKFLARLKCPNELIADVHQLVRHHMRLVSSTTLSDAAVRRLIRDLGPNLGRLLDLCEADASALKPGVKEQDLSGLRARIEKAETVTPAEALRSPITGLDVMAALNLEPGPKVGEVQRWLTDRVIEGELQPEDRESALALIQDHFGTKG